MGKKPVRHAMGGSTASGSNSFTPAATSGKQAPSASTVNEYQNPSRLKSPNEVEHLSRRKVKRMRTATSPHGVNTAPQGDLSPEDVDALRGRLDSLENENHALRNELGQVKQQQSTLVRNARHRAFRERLARRRNDLLLCENEGVDLDLNEEMGTQEEGGDAFTMDDRQWARKIDGIRKRYSRSIATRSLPMNPALMAQGEGRQRGTPEYGRDAMWENVRRAQAAGAAPDEQKAAYRQLANGVAS
jgi:hypothetical protein